MFIFYYYNRITKTAIATTTKEKAIQVLAYGGGKFKIGQPCLVRTSCCYNSWQKEKGIQGKESAEGNPPLQQPTLGVTNPAEGEDPPDVSSGDVKTQFKPRSAQKPPDPESLQTGGHCPFTSTSEPDRAVEARKGAGHPMPGHSRVTLRSPPTVFLQGDTQLTANGP